VYGASDNLAYTKQISAPRRESDEAEPRGGDRMSNYYKTEAASDIAAAFRARSRNVGTDIASANLIAMAPQRAPMTGTGLSTVVFGKGHPPRGIPPL